MKAGKALGEVRLIGGVWKRSKLAVPDKPGLRPTPDRVRETLFNWLGQDLSGWAGIDVFAGTGALGLEAASRGAKSMLLCELDPMLAAQLQQTCQKLQASQVQVRRGDGLAALRSMAPASLDLVLLDPPFDSQLFAPALAAAAAALRPDGWVYLESPQRWPAEALVKLGLGEYRYLKAGAVHAQLLQRLPLPGQ